MAGLTREVQIGASARPAILRKPSKVDSSGVITEWSETRVLAYPAFVNPHKWRMLCEHEDGTLEAERIDYLRFNDGLFGEYLWLEKDSKKV